MRDTTNAIIQRYCHASFVKFYPLDQLFTRHEYEKQFIVIFLMIVKTSFSKNHNLDHNKLRSKRRGLLVFFVAINRLNQLGTICRRDNECSFVKNGFGRTAPHRWTLRLRWFLGRFLFVFTLFLLPVRL